jgi:chromosome segregation ATPase
LIESNSRRQEEYANKISVTAMEFERELSELDQQSLHLESQIAEVQSNKEKMLGEIKSTEEKMKEWEKKIQVEKETEKELHTSKDAIDTKGMETEIKRMKHRLESLVRTQEQLLREMEISIKKREDIAVKYRGASKST